jgi:CO/xanthine dehydrogenase Mo-binding subunit
MIAGTGAIIVSFTLLPGLAGAQERKLPGSLSSDGRSGGGPGTPQLDGWIRIASNGDVTICTGKVELGTGLLTALSQVAAEELVVAIDSIKIISGDSERSPDEGASSSSRGMFDSGTAIRHACADAREILLELAAERLAVPTTELSVDNATITATGGRGAVTYRELIGDRQFNRNATATAPLVKASDHRYIGKSVARLDFPDKVFGGTSFICDLRLPDMLHARVVRPHTNGIYAELAQFSDTAARRFPGVQVVRDGNFVAVLAEREEHSIWVAAALEKTIRWKPKDLLPKQADLVHLLKSLPVKRNIVRPNIGDTKTALGTATQVIEATYTLPYQAHASIGPPCAVAQLGDGKLTIWSHTQQPYPLRNELSRILGMPEEKIHVIHMEGSGCFGDNGADDVAGDAAALALLANGRPVRVQHTRADMFAWEPKSSATIIEMRGGLNADGKIIALESEYWTATHASRFRRVGEGTLMPFAWHRAASMPGIWPLDVGGGGYGFFTYQIPNMKAVAHVVDSPMRPGSLRAPGGFQFGLATEAFVDELAEAAGRDPLAFRLDHLGNPRFRDVVEKVAEISGWRTGASQPGNHGRGIAITGTREACAAIVVDATCDRDSGVIRVTDVYATADAGCIVNPDGIIAQIEGNVMQTLSRTLVEEINFNEKGTTTLDWTHYPILSFDHMPQVETALIDRPDQGFGGVGELHTVCIAPAVANAVYFASGVRLRDVPFTPARVKTELMRTGNRKA